LSRRTALLYLLAAVGLVLYLWPALRAPVVLWSDSVLDLDWARQGVGIVGPPPPSGGTALLHSAKPGWLLFLRGVLAVAPSGAEERTIVVVQSLLVYASILITALLAERRCRGTGIVLLLVLLSFLRLRDTASAVMPEALSAALLLPLVAWALQPPRARTGLLFFGLGIAVLFWIRPNVGGVALVLVLARIASLRRWTAATVLIGGFLLLVIPVWILTRPRAQGETLRGLGHAIVFGSTDYYWNPELGTQMQGRSRQEVEWLELAQAGGNWKALLRGSGPDVRRQLVWRGFHALLGTEFYDPRWSRAYEGAMNSSRVLTPFLTLLAISLLLAIQFGGINREPSSLGLLLVLLLVLQNVFLLSNPRFVLPFLPTLYFLAAMSATPLRLGNSRIPLMAGALFLLLVGLVATHRFVLDWEWGRIEKVGVTIRQRIPIRSLPRKEPATLHVRIAAPSVPSGAHLEIRGPAGAILYSSVRDGARQKPTITIPLPAAVLEANARSDIALELSSFGSYGEFQYLLFPVIPPPWGARATRDGSREISPTTGIRSGSLDWWAHAGRD
jgi:hypothetical protein